MSKLSEHIPTWASRYIGIPFLEHGRSREGLDCWGLVRLVYAERFGIHLPSLAEGYAGVDDSAGLAGVVVQERAISGHWKPITLDESSVGDVVLFRMSGDLWHVGLMVARGQMLHVWRRVNSCVERINTPNWTPRLFGVHRYAAPVRVTGRVAPMQSQVFSTEVPEGGSITDILTAAAIAPSPFLRVYVGDAEVPRDRWPNVRPRAGRLVTVAAIPAGGQGGSKNAMRIVASIAIIVAAAIAGPAIAGPGLGLAEGTGGFIAVSAVSTAAIGIAGTLAVNALIPPGGQKLSEGASRQSPSIAGGRNEYRPFSPFPRVLGSMRMAPIFAAIPYTEIDGDDQYLRCAFTFGYGPLDITDLQIGDTPIDQFAGVEIEIRNGYPDDEPLRIYPGTVNEQALSVLLQQADGWTTRTTEAGTDEISVDFTWPQGLVKFNADGTRSAIACSVEVEYSPAGTGAWRQINDTSPDFSRGMDFMFRKRGSITIPYIIGEADGNGAVAGTVEWGGTWPNAKPAFLPISSYAVEYYGYLYCPTIGDYQFAVDGSDSIELIIDDVTVLTWYGTHEPDNAFGSHTVTTPIRSTGYRPGAGWHKIRIRLESRSPNGGALAVGWKKPGDGAFATIPAANFRSYGEQTPGALSYRWFDTSQYGSTITLRESRSDTMRRSVAWPVERGQYDVRVRRSTLDSTSDSTLDKVYVTAIRSITNEEPLNIGGMARVALRIKATDQLNGSIDTLNAKVTSILPDWDAASGTWIERATSSPAAAFRAVLQGPGNKRPLTDDRIDLVGLQEWAVEAASRGLEFNGIFDTTGTVFDRLADIAAAGRATPGMSDDKYSVVRDRPQSVPVQHFTPRNSFGYRGKKVFLEETHGLRVRFLDRANDNQQDERIVLDDGYQLEGLDAFGNLAPSLPPATNFGTLEVFGCTSAAEAWKHGRYFIAVSRLRPEVHELSTDVEHLVCRRGDLVLVTHDVPMFGLGFGRVAALIVDTDDNLTGLKLDEKVTMDAAENYSIRIRLEDGTSFLRQVVTAAGESDTITLAAPVAASDPRPDVGDLFMFGRTGQETRELVVKSIEMEKDLAARLTLVDHAPAVHQADVGVIPDFDPGISQPVAYQNRPETPVIESIRSDDYVMVRGSDGTLQPRMVLQLQRPAGRRPLATMAEVLLRPVPVDGGTPQGPFSARPMIPISNQTVTVAEVEEGTTYQIRLRTVTPIGQASNWVDATHTIVGKTAPPPDITSLQVERLSDGTRKYSWVIPNPPPDLAGVEIRYGESWMVWDQMTAVFDQIQQTSPVEHNDPPAGTWRFAAKAVDTSGNVSRNAIYLDATLGSPRLEGVVYQDDSGLAGWPGTLTGCAIKGTVLEAVDRATWSTLSSGFSVATWAQFVRWNMGPTSPIEYESTALDAGFVFAFSPDAIADGEGVLVVEVATSVDGLSWTDWEEVSLARRSVRTARYVKAKVTCSASGSAPIPRITRLLVMMRAAAVVHEIQDLDTSTLSGPYRLGVGDIRLPIPAGSFAAVRSVTLGFNNSGAGYTWDLVDRDAATGPRVRLYDANHQLADATIDAIVRGL